MPIAASLLRVDISSSSQSIRFVSELARVETDDKAELQQIFRPMDLSSGEEFHGCEIFEVFVVRDDINQRSWTFKVVSPDFEGFEDRE